MANQPYFSIIIPTLNEERFLPRLLQNLIEQTTQKFEVIHVDGHSDDKTREIAQKISSRLPTFIQVISQVRHVSHQRNLGAKTAKGQFLLFIDADTQLPPYFLEGLSYQLHKSPADLFTTWSTPDSNRPGDNAIVTIINAGLEVAHLLDAPFAIGVFLGCTPKAFQKIGGFDQKINYGEDEEFIKTGAKKRLTFTVFREPRFIYSLRRFRTEGTLSTLQNIALKRLSFITKPVGIKANYPMGGHLFKDDNPAANNLFTRLETTLTQLKKHPKVRLFIKNLLDIELK